MKPNICASAAHCSGCRDREAGVQFRRGLKVLLRLDRDDFECPFGRPWGTAATPLPPARTMTQVAGLVEAHCDACEHSVVGPADDAWPDGMPGCRLVQNCLNQPCFSKFTQRLVSGGGCPIGRFFATNDPNGHLTAAK